MEANQRRREEGLRAFILSRIEEGGPIPFSQFMEWCLYHPQYGYYRSERLRMGKAGDYYTSPCVHPLFGGLVAKQLAQMAALLGKETFDVVEAGGGQGFLCKDIFDWTERKEPELFKRLRYYLIEPDSHLVDFQKRLLSERVREDRLRWLDLSAFEKGEYSFQGCILSNELIDAFPVHCVVKGQEGLKEVFVTQEDGHFREVWGEPSDPGIPRYVDLLGADLAEGQRVEVNLRALDWMEDVEKSLSRGFALTIDYGYLTQELYAPFRWGGTLVGYSRHRVTEDPFENPGGQDLTAHVNFSALIQKGEEIGLRFTGLVPQYRFLMGLGLLQEMEEMAREMSSLEALKVRLSLKHLIEPERGMGEVFKVLIQHKGVDDPQLDGLRDFHALSKSSGGKGI